MNNDQSVASIDRKASFWEALLKGALAGLWLGAILFISAGRLDWAAGWVYIGISTVMPSCSCLSSTPS